MCYYKACAGVDREVAANTAAAELAADKAEDIGMQLKMLPKEKKKYVQLDVGPSLVPVYHL